MAPARDWQIDASVAGDPMDSNDAIAVLARELFNCMRNVHVNLSAGDGTAGRRSIADARSAYDSLVRVAGSAYDGEFKAVLLEVLKERLDSLNTMVEHVADGSEGLWKLGAEGL
jgi:hypothetical protein